MSSLAVLRLSDDLAEFIGGAVPPSRSATVLVVDDLEASARLLEHLLTQDGHGGLPQFGSVESSGPIGDE